MYCPWCGVPLREGTRKCTVCGCDLTKPTDNLLQTDSTGESEQKSLAAQLKAQAKARAEALEKTNSMLLTTCDCLEGYRVTEQLGLVFGEDLFKTGLLSSLSAGLTNAIDTLTPGDRELSGSARLLETARGYALDKMKLAALAKGANAVIGVNADSSIEGELIHIVFYGTAVKVEKK